MFADPRAHIYYLPELYSRLFRPLLRHAPRAAGGQTQAILDPDDAFELHPPSACSPMCRTTSPRNEMNPFDAALALLALGHLGAAALDVQRRRSTVHRAPDRRRLGPRSPFKAYEWNKMKTPTRILVGGPEVTSAFVLMGLDARAPRDDERKNLSRRRDHHLLLQQNAAHLPEERRAMREPAFAFG
jgi:hypothetical protein